MPRLLEQPVELGAMLLGHLAADGSNALVDVGVGEPLSTDGDANRLQQRRRQLECVRVRDVEAVHEPRPHEVEVRVGGAAGVAVERAQPLEHVACVVLGLEDLAGGGILCDRSRSSASSADAPAETGAAPA